MDIAWNVFDMQSPELSKIYCTKYNSLPISICVGLLQICGSYTILHKKCVDYIINTFKIIIDHSRNYFPDNERFLKYFIDCAEYLANLNDPRLALNQLDGLLNQYESLCALDKASKIIIGTLMIKKLLEATEPFSPDIFLSGDELVKYQTRILLLVNNSFLVCIQIYERNESNGSIEKSMSKPIKGGIFPVINLYKNQKKYSLACVKELYLLKTDPNTVNNIIDDMPYIFGKGKKHSPIELPSFVAQIDYSNDSQVFKTIIDMMAKELRAKGGFSEELKSLIYECSQNNQTIKTIPSLFETPLYCRKCNTKLAKSNYSNTSHVKCGFCDLCLSQLNNYCIICNLPLTENDKELLGI